MKFGIIGFGKIARKFVVSIEATKSGEVHAIASRSLSETDKYLLAHPEVMLYRNYEALLSDTSIQAVYIALPHANHFEWIKKSLLAGKAVLCEKPAVLTAMQMYEISQLVRETDGYFLEALKTPLNHGFQSLKRDLKKIGDINHIEASFGFDASELQGSNNYLFDPVQGGAVYDVGSYLYSFVVGLMDEELIHQAATTVRDKKGVILTFTNELIFTNGASANVSGSIEADYPRTAIMYGTLGKISVPMFNRLTSYMIELEDGEAVEHNYPFVGDDMTLQIERMIADCEQGRQENTWHSLKQTQRIIEQLEYVQAHN